MQDPPPDRIWYLPQHPFENPNKPGKVRRDADAASKYRGRSLNTNLLTSTDLLNCLLGVPMRFHENPVAVLADIEGMFMQIAINQIDHWAHRFPWINDNKLQQSQFWRLIFGATFSHPVRSMFWIIASMKTEINIPKQSEPSKLTFIWMITSSSMIRQQMPQKRFSKRLRVSRKAVSASQKLFLMNPMFLKTYQYMTLKCNPQLRDNYRTIGKLCTLTWKKTALNQLRCKIHRRIESGISHNTLLRILTSPARFGAMQTPPLNTADDH